MNLAVSKAQLIGLDWGTSSLRAYLIGEGGAVLESCSSSLGIMSVKNRDFQAVFDEIAGPWRAQKTLPVMASGMITSRNGWVETPYVAASAGADELANAIVKHPLMDGSSIHFITGLSTQNNGAPDVMRGEETQIIGAVAQGLRNATFVMPGTHSKWASAKDGQITGYQTYMTGEIFAALKGHTILGTLMQEGSNEEGFALGVQSGLKAGADILHRLFHVRTLPLFEKLSSEMVADYMSGLLIGTEINAGRSALDAGQSVTLIGRGDLTTRYGVALSMADIPNTPAPENIVVHGLYEIAKSAGLIT